MSSSSSGLEERLAQRGITCRQYLKFRGLMAATLALPMRYTPSIAEALSTAPRLPLVWREFQDCAGNAVARLHPAIADPDIIDQAILAVQSPEAIVQAALDHMRALVPCRWASVAMFDSHARVIAVLATHSNHQDEPKQALTAHTSSGLAGMVGRVRLLDGQLTIESRPGQGTRLSAKRQLGATLTER